MKTIRSSDMDVLSRIQAEVRMLRQEWRDGNRTAALRFDEIGRQLERINRRLDPRGSPSFRMFPNRRRSLGVPQAAFRVVQKVQGDVLLRQWSVKAFRGPVSARTASWLIHRTRSARRVRVAWNARAIS